MAKKRNATCVDETGNYLPILKKHFHVLKVKKAGTKTSLNEHAMNTFYEFIAGNR